MCDLENNVRHTWQLLSQFVSWEFCRYMSEPNENCTEETDVLTFLRNMIVQRTEKSVSDITKHEIVAKFIMEIKAMQNISRMPYILALSESVKKMCPELESIVSKLVYHLETFLNVIQSSDEYRRELIQSRINDEINEFSKEAERLLPQPDLLQVVESWNHHQGHMPQKFVKKVIYNAVLFEKVLECLHFESITPSEAKLIAAALYEDRVFDRMLINAEAEPTETEADSEQFSLSLHSSQPNEHMYSQEFGKNVNIQINQATTDAKSSHIVDSQVPDDFPGVPDDFSRVPDEIHEAPPELNSVQAPVLSSSSSPDPVLPLLTRNNVPEPNGNLENCLNNSHMQFAQSSDNESISGELNSALHNRINEKLNVISKQRNQSSSGSDTSDCDKNPQFKFLTPTFYKKNTNKAPAKSQIVWLSDMSSNDSSIITTAPNSQQYDPNWSTKLRKSLTQAEGKRMKMCLRTQTEPLVSSDSDSNDSQGRTALRKDPTYRMKDKFKLIPSSSMPTRRKPVKKKARVLESDSSESIHNSLIENQGNLLHRVQQLPSTSVSEVEVEERPAKKRRQAKTAKLYRSPDISLEDFVHQIRRPVPVVTNEVPVHHGTNTLNTKRNTPQTGKTSLKRQKCKQCSKSFKTAVALRRHVFLQHTNPAPDSDCDSG